MSNPKWQVGPVKLVDGSDGIIHRFCETRKRYIGEILSGSLWYACEWTSDGKNWTGRDLLNLAPPPKKTVRVRFWINIYPTGWPVRYKSRESADTCASDDRIACIEIDRVVEEGEGL